MPSHAFAGADLAQRQAVARVGEIRLHRGHVAMTGLTDRDDRSTCSHYRNGKRQAWGDAHHGPQFIAGGPHPPATDQPGPRRTTRPRHRRDPAPRHRQTTAHARHSTPNAASASCHGNPAEHQTQGIFSAPQSGPGHGRIRGRAAVVGTSDHPACREDQERHDVPTPPGGATGPVTAIPSRRIAGRPRPTTEMRGRRAGRRGERGHPELASRPTFRAALVAASAHRRP